MKWIIYLIMLVMTLPLVTATEMFIPPDTTSVLYANCISEELFVNSTANITTYYPNQSVWLDNVAMTNYSLGKFYVNVTSPNITGEYQQVVTCKRSSDGNFAQNGATFQVKDLEEETGLAALAVVIGLLAFIGGMIFIAFKLENSRMGALKIPVQLFFFGMALFSMLLVPAALMSATGSSGDVAETFFIVVTWIIRVVVVFGFVGALYYLFMQFAWFEKVLGAFNR